MTLSANPAAKWAQGLNQFDDSGARLSSLSAVCLLSLISEALIPPRQRRPPSPAAGNFSKVLWRLFCGKASRHTRSGNPAGGAAIISAAPVEASPTAVQSFTIGSRVFKSDHVYMRAAPRT